MTGAPKIRALEVIHELEAVPREIYTGAVGYRSPVAGLELNVAIRTFEFSDGRVWLGAGGGIVADSQDEDEFPECLLKAAPLIRAAGGALSAGPAEDARPDRNRPRTGRRCARGQRPGCSPRCWSSGARRVTSARHLARLGDSARQLYGKDLPPSLYDDLAACLAQHPSGRLRITAQPVGGQLRATRGGHPGRRAAGDGAAAPRGHTGRSRRPQVAGPAPAGRAQPAAAARPGEQLLIEDAGGEALETDRASVFAVVDGSLRTPPADGRILPGVTRAAVLAAARLAGVEVSEGTLTRAQLAEASEVFVTNALRGVVPVEAIGGARWPARRDR